MVALALMELGLQYEDAVDMIRQWVARDETHTHALTAFFWDYPGEPVLGR